MNWTVWIIFAIVIAIGALLDVFGMRRSSVKAPRDTAARRTDGTASRDLSEREIFEWLDDQLRILMPDVEERTRCIERYLARVTNFEKSGHAKRTAIFESIRTDYTDGLAKITRRFRNAFLLDGARDNLIREMRRRFPQASEFTLLRRILDDLHKDCQWWFD